ncbi:MAG: archaemetzincin, partial [Anaerolineae bacterium]
MKGEHGHREPEKEHTSENRLSGSAWPWNGPLERHRQGGSRSALSPLPGRLLAETIEDGTRFPERSEVWLQKAAPALFMVLVALVCGGIYLRDGSSPVGSIAARAASHREQDPVQPAPDQRQRAGGGAGVEQGQQPATGGKAAVAKAGSSRTPGAEAKGSADLFSPLPRPGDGEWRAVFNEPSQSFGQFVARRWNRPDGRRNKIYLLPLGFSPRKCFPDLDLNERFISAYFMVPAAVMPPDDLKHKGFTFRKNPYTGKPQVRTRGILYHLFERLPPDAFGLVALTTHDLYPEASWNYVFGEAMLSSRVAVFSLTRFDPAFFGGKRRRASKRERQRVVRRSLSLIAHEIGHMFGILHCKSYRCCMNGSNSLEELDQQPIHLCPRCLRKLQHHRNRAQRFHHA